MLCVLLCATWSTLFRSVFGPSSSSQSENMRLAFRPTFHAVSLNFSFFPFSFSPSHSHTRPRLPLGILHTNNYFQLNYSLNWIHFSNAFMIKFSAEIPFVLTRKQRFCAPYDSSSCNSTLFLQFVYFVFSLCFHCCVYNSLLLIDFTLLLKLTSDMEQ